MAHPDTEQPKLAATMRPQPAPTARPRPEPSPPWSRTTWIGIGGGIVLMAAIAGSFFLSMSQEPRPTPVAQQNQGGQDQGVNAGATTNAARMFKPVPLAEREKAVAALIMSDVEKGKVRQAVANNTMRLAWVTLSDSEAEDGDWVQVTAGGFNQNVRLFKAPLRIVVPYVPGMPVAVTGLIDGDGGGITVAVHSGESTFGLKPLVKGETIMVPTP